MTIDPSLTWGQTADLGTPQSDLVLCNTADSDSCLGWTCLIICECLLYVILVIRSDERPPHCMHSRYSNPTDADAIGTYRFPMHIIVSL